MGRRSPATPSIALPPGARWLAWSVLVSEGVVTSAVLVAFVRLGWWSVDIPQVLSALPAWAPWMILGLYGTVGVWAWGTLQALVAATWRQRLLPWLIAHSGLALQCLELGVATSALGPSTTGAAAALRDLTRALLGQLTGSTVAQLPHALLGRFLTDPIWADRAPRDLVRWLERLQPRHLHPSRRLPPGQRPALLSVALRHHDRDVRTAGLQAIGRLCPSSAVASSPAGPRRA